MKIRYLSAPNFLKFKLNCINISIFIFSHLYPIRFFKVSIKVYILRLQAVAGSILEKRLPEKFCKICWKTPVPKSLFCSLNPTSLLQQKLRQICFLVHFGKYLRTPILQNIRERLLQKDLWKKKLTLRINYSFLFLG